jgi:hypothetical protein
MCQQCHADYCCQPRPQITDPFILVTVITVKILTCITSGCHLVTDQHTTYSPLLSACDPLTLFSLTNSFKTGLLFTVPTVQKDIQHAVWWDKVLHRQKSMCPVVKI